MTKKINKFSETNSGYNETALLREVSELKDELIRIEKSHLEDLRNHYAFLKALLFESNIDASELQRQFPLISNN